MGFPGAAGTLEEIELVLDSCAFTPGKRANGRYSPFTCAPRVIELLISCCRLLSNEITPYPCVAVCDFTIFTTVGARVVFFICELSLPPGVKQ